MANDYDPYSDHGTQASQYDSLDPYWSTSADIPLWGWLSGASSKVDAARAQDEATRNRNYWDSLRAPTADQLMGPAEDREAQMAALSQMQEWGRGGLTQADRAALESTRQRDAQAAGSAQRSLMQQAQARGVGGGGLDFATRQQASQMGQQQSSDAESQMLQGAQQRALAAVQASGNLAGAVREQDVGATQQSWEDAANRAAGATGQYGTDVGSANARSQRRQQEDQGLMSLLGTILSTSSSS